MVSKRTWIRFVLPPAAASYHAPRARASVRIPGGPAAIVAAARSTLTRSGSGVEEQGDHVVAETAAQRGRDDVVAVDLQPAAGGCACQRRGDCGARQPRARLELRQGESFHQPQRSEEHTSELQSRENLVCRLL